MAGLKQLMSLFRAGDKDAARQLIETFYPELRRLAAARMRGERATHTWQPTTLVNELYLELMKLKRVSGDYENQDDKTAFLGLASHVMKRLLIHHARPLDKRVERVELQESQFAASSPSDSIEEIDELLHRLATVHPRLRAVVEMRVFEGCTVDEISRRLECSPATVARSWSFAKTWLRQNMTPN